MIGYGVWNMVRSVTPGGRLTGPRTTFSPMRGFVVGALALGTPALLIAGWLAVHQVSGLAPWLADGLRRVLGVEGVARLEEAAYGAEDRFNSVWRRGERPRAYWSVPPEAAPSVVSLASSPAPTGAGVSIASPASGLEPGVSATPAATAAPPAFRPSDVGPPYAELGAPGDGRWVVLPDETPPERAHMFKTLLHPDPERAWAELFVVALDLRRVRLQLVAGTLEPQATVPEAASLPRPGRVPDSRHAAVLAAFNGGFKTEHGHYGMSVDGLTLLPPREQSCTIVRLDDGSLRISTWSRLSDQVAHALWWRQTPDCMYEDGVVNPRLADGLVRRWGSTLGGETVIRRSAIGIDAAGTTLYVGISNHTTAPVLARGMHHAGARDIAQLDVNFSYPKFVTFRQSPASKLRLAVPLAAGFDYAEDDYLRKASPRDFFYVLDGAEDDRTARN
jgi:hypothetical protein